MFIINAYWTVVAGQEVAAREALADLAQQIKEKEHDTWMYLVHVSNTDPGINAFPPAGAGAITFWEGYKNRHAFERHASGPILQKFIKDHGALFLNMYGPTSPFMMYQGLDRAAGFIRPKAAEPSLFTVIARWSIRPGDEAKVHRALQGYVAQVYEVEPYTSIYTANVPDQSAHLPSYPTSAPNQLVFNSGWENHDAFIEHTKAQPYQDFLADHGHLFLQANGAKTNNQPYMTTAVLKRIAGFFRKEAFTAHEGTKA